MWRFRKTPTPTEGAAARVKAEIALEKTKKQTPKIRAIGDSFREIREENHLAQAFREMFQEGT